jgi:uncharacterized protein (TIGR02186 family)
MTQFTKRAALLKLLVLMLTLGGVIAPQVRAESVVADLTSHHIAVEFDFSGAQLTLFGAVIGEIKKDAEPADIVVVIEGPSTSVRVRRKDKAAGIWVNRESKALRNIPAFYAIVSSRPVTDFTKEGLRKLLRLNLDTLPMSGGTGEINQGHDTREFIDAYVRLKKQKRHYLTAPKGITFVGRNLFRATVRLPADVQIGSYTARVNLIRRGKLLGQYATKFEIRKEGVEGLVSRMAHEQPLLFGILSVLLAVAAGLSAAYIFRSPTAKA